MTTFYDIDEMRVTIAEQAAMIERQRVAIETLLKAAAEIQKLLDDKVILSKARDDDAASDIGYTNIDQGVWRVCTRSTGYTVGTDNDRE